MKPKPYTPPTEASLLVIKLLAEKFRDIEAEIMEEIASDTKDDDNTSSYTCHNCGSTNLAVIDKRDRKDGTIRRVKECNACGERFGTIEAFWHIIPDRPNRKKSTDCDNDG